MPRPIFWAPISWSHVGSHSGFTPLFRQVEIQSPGLAQRLAGEQTRSSIVERVGMRIGRLVGMPRPTPAWVEIRAESPFYSESAWSTERRISEIVLQLGPAAILLEGIEDQLFSLAKERKQWPKTRLIGVCHQPPAWWQLQHARPDIVESLDCMIVLSSVSQAYWGQVIKKERILLIPHGVDVEFFSPAVSGAKLSSQDGVLRAVFSGQWLRDFETLEAVVSIADELKLPLRFELIVPRFARGADSCYRMAMSPRVRWHSGLTDEGLRNVYRQSDLLLLTLRDCTANNSLLEGMACGLPVIVTDVGGVRDYAQGGFADFVRPHDALGIIDVLRGYLDQRDGLTKRGTAARAHAENHLSWKKVAGQYIDLLRSVN
jgi:hypothetical protein